MKKVCFALVMAVMTIITLSCREDPPCGGGLKLEPGDIKGYYSVNYKLYVDDVAAFTEPLKGRISVYPSEKELMYVSFDKDDRIIAFLTPETHYGTNLDMGAKITGEVGNYTVGWSGKTDILTSGNEYFQTDGTMTGKIVRKKATATTRCSPVAPEPRDKFHDLDMTIEFTAPAQGAKAARKIRFEISTGNISK